MKIMINYDFVEALKNVNEPLGPFKIIRNEKRTWVKFHLPLYYLLDLAFLKKFSYATIAVISQFGLLTFNKVLESRIYKEDKYFDKSKSDLIKLVPKLDALNIRTSYTLLCNAEQYDKEYTIYYNKDKLPSLLESKYVLVPYYSYNGEISDVSITQEHIVGSNNYELSVGSPSKKLKLVKSFS